MCKYLNKYSRSITCINLFLIFWKTGNPYEHDLNEFLDPRVKIPHGDIRGVYKITSKNTTYASYEGMPYAEAPIGPLRFKDPVPIERWEDILEALEPGSRCMQIEDGQVVGEENCLFLNVYIPQARDKDSYLPVMFYIHGGGFSTGSSVYLSRPDHFIEENVVYVSINYRLGVFGFLCLNSDDVPGNAGMKDQVMALKWVKSNIKHFGGDPENITVFGESAGGMSAHLLQISPMSRGMMSKMISLSGASFCEWGIQKQPIEVVHRLATFLGLKADSSGDVDFLQKIQNLNAREIIKAAARVQALVPGDIEDLPFSPVIEQVFDEKEAFLNKSISQYYNNHDYDDVPVMIGYSSKEYAMFYDSTNFETLLKNPLIIVPNKWRPYLSKKGLKNAYNEIIRFFFGLNQIDLKNQETFINALNLFGDIMFLRGIDETAKLMGKLSKKPIYYFRFSYRGVINGAVLDELGVQGATHGEEILFLFSSEQEDDASSDGWVRRRLLKMFTNMATYGNPTPGPQTNLLPTKWLPVKESIANYMEINGENTPSVDPDGRRMRFWSALETKVLKGNLGS